MADHIDYEIVDDPERGRLEARIVGGSDAGAAAGFLRYLVDGDVVTIPSTVVQPAYRQHGIASALTRAALDRIRADGRRVRPVCWYVDGWLERHPEYADLRDATMDR